MATSTSYRPVTVTQLDRDGWDQAEIDDGQGLVMGAVGFTSKQFNELIDANHPAIIAWEQMVDEVAIEIAPQVRDLFYEAINKRLPWTWEPER